MKTYNGGCNCSDPTCHAALPVTPVEHALRLEVTDEWAAESPNERQSR